MFKTFVAFLSDNGFITWRENKKLMRPVLLLITGQLWARPPLVRAADTSFFSWTSQVRNYSLLCREKKEKPVAKINRSCLYRTIRSVLYPYWSVVRFRIWVPSEFRWIQWIWIRIWNPNLDPEGSNFPYIGKKLVINFYALKSRFRFWRHGARKFHYLRSYYVSNYRNILVLKLHVQVLERRATTPPTAVWRCAPCSLAPPHCAYATSVSPSRR